MTQFRYRYQRSINKQSFVSWHVSPQHSAHTCSNLDLEPCGLKPSYPTMQIHFYKWITHHLIILDANSWKTPCKSDSRLDRSLPYLLLQCSEPIPRSVLSDVLPVCCSYWALWKIEDVLTYPVPSSIPSSHEQPFDDLAAYLF